VPYGVVVRIDQGYLGWGVFFVAAGAIALAIGAGVVVDQRWWSFWPLLLVGAGIGLVLRKTAFEVIGGLIVAATFGVMVGGSLAGGFGGFSGIGDVGGIACDGGDGTAFADQSGTLGASASVDIQVDCGTLSLSTVPGSTWTVRGTDGDGLGPRISSSGDELEVQSTDGLASSSSWLIDLPTDPTLEVNLQLDAGSLQAAFVGARLREVDVEVNAGQARIDLTGVSDITSIDAGVNAGEVAVTLPSWPMTGRLEVNAGAVRLCAPPDVALRIETEGSVLSGTDLSEAGLVEEDGVWVTPGYDVAPVRIDLEVQANLGSIRLNPAEGCT